MGTVHDLLQKKERRHGIRQYVLLSATSRREVWLPRRERRGSMEAVQLTALALFVLFRVELGE